MLLAARLIFSAYCCRVDVPGIAERAGACGLWTCAMPPWGQGCDVPEEQLIELARSTRGVDVAYSTTASAGDDVASGSHLAPGTVVWARQPGFKPWPSRCELPQSNVPPPKGTSVLVSYFGLEKHTCAPRPRTLAAASFTSDRLLYAHCAASPGSRLQTCSCGARVEMTWPRTRRA